MIIGLEANIGASPQGHRGAPMERPSEELAPRPSKYYTSHHIKRYFLEKAYKYNVTPP
jgi:hypothetical protein